MSNHSHSHHHHHDVSGKKLGFTVVLNLTITVAQIIGGIISNSLSLLSDAVHNASDGIALWIAYFANKLAKKNTNFKMTFGYKRIEIISAFVNSFTLIFICLFLIYHAYNRFINPEAIEGTLMLIVATIGLLANLISVIILKNEKDKNINTKAAYLHLLGDTLSSVAVIIGGLLIIYYDLYWVDPLVTLLIALYIIKETYGVLKESFDILIQKKPKEIDIDKIRKMVNDFENVNNFHHVHIWQLSDSDVYLECHVDIEKDLQLSEVDKLRNQLELAIRDNYNIDHITIQTEYNCCDDKAVIPDH